MLNILLSILLFIFLFFLCCMSLSDWIWIWNFFYSLMWKMMFVMLCGFIVLMFFLDSFGVLFFNWSYDNMFVIFLLVILGFLF